MKRNPAANCGNCPYWYWPAENDYGECRVNAPKAYTFNSGEVEFHLHTHNDHWCGQHPDFWEQAEITNTCPSCWPASDNERHDNDARE